MPLLRLWKHVDGDDQKGLRHEGTTDTNSCGPLSQPFSSMSNSTVSSAHLKKPSVQPIPCGISHSALQLRPSGRSRRVASKRGLEGGSRFSLLELRSAGGLGSRWDAERPPGACTPLPPPSCASVCLTFPRAPLALEWADTNPFVMFKEAVC